MENFKFSIVGSIFLLSTIMYLRPIRQRQVRPETEQDIHCRTRKADASFRMACDRRIAGRDSRRTHDQTVRSGPVGTAQELAGKGQTEQERRRDKAGRSRMTVRTGQGGAGA